MHEEHMKITHATAAILVALAAGCSSVTVKTDYDRSASFANLHTYAWRPGRPSPTGDPRFDSPELDAQIRAAVDRVLASKGYQLAGAGHDA